MKYRRIDVPRHGGPDVLVVVEEELPEPATGEVRVKVLAAGVSAYDRMLRCSGLIPGTPRVPYTPGEDVVGIVERRGEEVMALEPGQTVAGVTFARHGGGYAEYVCLPADNLVPVPTGVDVAEAVCLVVNYLTAHVAMHRTAKVQEGESILVHGAAGGVGTALLELGKTAGLKMYATASKHNHDLVSALGATPIDYHTEDFVERIRSLSGNGVDVVFDPVGDARQLWRSYHALRRGGRLVWFGVAATAQKGLWVIPRSLLMALLLSLIPDRKRVPWMPDVAKLVRTQNNWYQETLTGLLNSLAAGDIKPVVAERVPLLEAAYAHELLELGGHAGKIVLVTGE